MLVKVPNTENVLPIQRYSDPIYDALLITHCYCFGFWVLTHETSVISKYRKHKRTSSKIAMLMMEVYHKIGKASGWQICGMNTAMQTSLMNDGTHFCWIYSWPQNSYSISSSILSISELSLVMKLFYDPWSKLWWFHKNY